MALDLQLENCILEDRYQIKKVLPGNGSFGKIYEGIDL